MRVFISAGEASGDAYGAALVRELKRANLTFDEVETRVYQMMAAELKALQPFDPEGSFRETWEVDSMEDVEFVLDLEHEFLIKIPDQALLEWHTNRDIARYVAAQLPERPKAELTYEGVGGPRMKKEGVEIYEDSSKWGAISITQAVRVFFRVFGSLQRTKKHLRQGAPGLFVPIDFGFANIRMARYAKNRGWKVLYFVPPGSWRRDRQGKDLVEVADAVVTPFEWSAEILNRMGAKAYWFGHPIKQLIAEVGASVGERATVAVLPGSREHELEMNLPLIAAAIDGKVGEWKGLNVPGVSYDQISVARPPIQDRLEFALAPSVDLAAFKATWAKLAPGRDDLFTVGDTYGVLRRAKVGMICSGTATLEAAICRCPMVVVYQISPTMRREAKLLRMKRPKFIALPNIIVDREIVPELAERDGVHPVQVREWLDRLLGEPEVRERQLQDFEELDRLLGPSDAISQTAALALSMIAAKPS